MNLSCSSSACSAVRPRKEWKGRIVLAVAVAAAGILPAVAAEPAPAPVRNLTPSEQEKVLFFAEAARQSLIALGNSDVSSEVKSHKAPWSTGADVDRWVNVAVLLAMGGDSQGAFATAALHPNKDDETDVYGQLARAQARAGDVAGARKSAERFGTSDQDAPYWVQGEIAVAEARTGDLRAAKAMLDAPSGPEIEIAPVDGLFPAFRNGVLEGDAQDRKLLDELLATVPADKINPALGRLFALQAIGQARANELDKARATLANVTNPVMRTWVLRNIASQQAKMGDPAGARKTLAPGVAPLKAVISTGPEKPKAERTNDRRWWDNYRASLLRTLANCQARIGDVGAAKETVDLFKEGEGSDQYNPALAELAAVQAEVGDLSRAEEIAQSIKQPDMCAKATGYIAQVRLTKGDAKGARQNIEQALVPLREIRKKGMHLSAQCAAPVTRAVANLDGVPAAARLINELKPDHQENMVIEPFQEVAVMVARQQSTAEAKTWVEQQTGDPYVQAMYYVTMGLTVTGPAPLLFARDFEDD